MHPVDMIAILAGLTLVLILGAGIITAIHIARNLRDRP